MKLVSCTGFLSMLAALNQDLLGGIIGEVLAVAGISVIGPKMSSRTVRQAILEGGVMADIQVGHEIAKASSLTVSSDETTHKNINYESRCLHQYMSPMKLLQWYIRVA